MLLNAEGWSVQQLQLWRKGNKKLPNLSLSPSQTHLFSKYYCHQSSLFSSFARRPQLTRILYRYPAICADSETVAQKSLPLICFSHLLRASPWIGESTYLFARLPFSTAHHVPTTVVNSHRAHSCPSHRFSQDHSWNAALWRRRRRTAAGALVGNIARGVAQEPAYLIDKHNLQQRLCLRTH